MRHLRSLLGLGLLSGALMGCVSSGEYGAMESRFLVERENKNRLQRDVDSMRARTEAAEARAQAAVGEVDAAQAEIDRLDQALTDERNRASSLNQTLTSANQRVNSLMAKHQGLSSKLEKVMQELGKREGIEYEAGSGKLKLSASVLFSPGRAEIRSDGEDALRTLAAALSKGDELLRIEGHTDSDPVIHSRDRWPHGNWELSGHRALEVLAYLEKTGVTGDRMNYVGCGPHRPVGSNEDADGKARNRRVEIYVQPGPRRLAAETR